MKIIKISLIAILAILMMSACDKKETEEEENNNNTTVTQSTFTFMKQGTRWNYNSFDSEDPSVIIGEVFEITSLGTDGWASVKWSMAGMLIKNVDWYADNSVFCNLAQKNTLKKLNLCTANPAVNNSWSETWSTSTGSVTNTRTVVALNETVTVPAGTFTCIKIRETTSEDDVYYKNYWFNIQNGIIKTEGTTAEDYPTILYSELSSVSIP